MSKKYTVSYGLYETASFDDEAAAREFLAQNGGVLFEVDSNPAEGVKALADSQGDFEVSPYAAREITKK